MLDNNLNKSTSNLGITHLVDSNYSPGWIIKRKETVIEGKTQFKNTNRANTASSYVYKYVNGFNEVSSDHLIEHLLFNIVTFNLSQIFSCYYNDKNPNQGLTPSMLRAKVVDIYRKVVRKKCESFENEEQKKVFILLFAHQVTIFGISTSSYRNDKIVMENLIRKVKENTENTLSDFVYENLTDYSRYSYVINTNGAQLRRKPGLADIKRGDTTKVFPNTILANRISFFKKDDKYGILSFSFIDRDKMIHHENIKYSYTYTNWFEYLDYILRGNVPKHSFTHFFDIDTFLNPSLEHANFIKTLIKRLDPNQEIILGDGLQEFSNNFNYTSLRQFKTLKEKTEFINKVMKEILDTLKVRDISYLSLEEAKKKADEYNSAFKQEVKKEAVIVTEEVPANLDELMRFAELMSFEPDEGSPVAEGEEDNDDEEELTDREMSENPRPGIIEQITGVPRQGVYNGNIAEIAYSELMSRFGLNENELEHPSTPDGLLAFIESIQNLRSEQTSPLMFGGTGDGMNPELEQRFREMFHQPSENTTDPGYITGIDPAISPNIQDELTFTRDGNIIISDLPETVTTISVAEIREQLNNLTNNTNV